MTKGKSFDWLHGLRLLHFSPGMTPLTIFLTLMNGDLFALGVARESDKRQSDVCKACYSNDQYGKMDDVIQSSNLQRKQYMTTLHKYMRF